MPTRLPTSQHGRALAWVAGIVAALLLLLAATLLAAWRTETGARMLWQAAQRFAPGKLEGELLGGTLADGLRLRALRYEDAQRSVAVDSVEGAWRLSFSPLALSIDSLALGRVELTQQPTPPEPATMPPSLRLPLALEIRDLRVRELIVREAGKEGGTQLRDLRLQANSDGVRHRLRLQQADTPYGRVRASLNLAGDAPYPLDGAASIEGRVQEQEFRADARLSGSLETLRIDADGGAGKLNGQAGIEASPFAQVPLRRAVVKIDDFNPQALRPDLPEALLRLRATLEPEGTPAELSQLVVRGPVELVNASPGRIDKGRLPLVSADMKVRLDAQRQQIEAVTLKLSGDGELSGKGEMRTDGSGEFSLQARDLDLNALHGALLRTSLDGPLTLRQADGRQTVGLDLADPSMQASADIELTPAQIGVQTARLQSGDTRLDLRGTLARAGNGEFSASGQLQDFNPARFAARMPPAARGKRKFVIPRAQINMSFEAEGALRPELAAALRFDIDDSSYDGLPMAGSGRVSVAGKRLLPSELQLTVAGNDALLKGSFGAPGDRVSFDIDAPALDRLGFGLAGRLRLEGDAAGTIERPVVNAAYRGQDLAFGDHRLAFLEGEASMQGVPGTSPDALIDLDLQARGLRSGDLALDSISADLDGSYARHTLRAEAEGKLRGQALALSTSARGRLRETPQGLAWDGTLDTLENRTQPRIALGAPLPLALAPGFVEAGSTRLSIAQADIALQQLRYDHGRLRTAGGFSALDVGRLLALQQQFTGKAAPVSTSLVLDGSWDLSLAETGSGFLRIDRRSGDVSIPGAAGERPLGLSTLSLRADLQGESLVFAARTEAARIGSVRADGRLQLQRSGELLAPGPDSPLDARVVAEVPRLQSIAALAGPRIALDGAISADISITGTASSPRLAGRVDGERLALTLYDQGVRLSDGTAHLVLRDNIVELREVLFHGGEGTLRATGSIDVGNGGEDLRARIVADRLQLLASPSGRLTISGQAEAAQADGQTLVSGKFVVDRALFSLPEKSAPRLDDDVVVIRGDRPQPARREQPGDKRASPLSPRVDVVVDLGRNFRFEGAGAELRLAGGLNLRSAPGETPQAIGTVRVAEGTYEAFGAELDIERGLINFQGPLANPNLNILAMRREQEVEAGVLVTGTVQNPRVQLVSEPTVSDEEKLSWLIFGRGGGGAEQGQASAAAQGAALGLLNKFGGARVAKGLGLDELSIGSSEYGMEGSQVVNLGKEITDRLTVGYEQSLAGAESVLKLTYQLSRSWTVVLRGGAVTGIDLSYNKRFDGDRK
ncbi:translocation/assembly module TamB domain-containing protein [Noviherbaspirillum aridicola]|uniref:DUF490 domain-containing protein n=1 Tax=Noviherbaspirillum aridicola TaxID=2849687 RepID=A0ABQ4PZG6_9BURK|nr:translocation/assembly module TamB domain-containing protein [Noviherbaspirillum aridicola]GIZ50216.1 DUF490 domain-containing protein [Noviherbaspirillum aridicola]